MLSDIMIGWNDKKYGVIQRELHRKPLLGSKDIQFVCISSLLSKTQFIRQQNGSKLQ